MGICLDHQQVGPPTPPLPLLHSEALATCFLHMCGSSSQSQNVTPILWWWVTARISSKNGEWEFLNESRSRLGVCVCVCVLGSWGRTEQVWVVFFFFLPSSCVIAQQDPFCEGFYNLWGLLTRIYNSHFKPSCTLFLLCNRNGTEARFDFAKSSADPRHPSERVKERDKGVNRMCFFCLFEFMWVTGREERRWTVLLCFIITTPVIACYK